MYINLKQEGINQASSKNELQLRATDAVFLQKVNSAAKCVPFINRSLLIVSQLGWWWWRRLGRRGRGGGGGAQDIRVKTEM